MREMQRQQKETDNVKHRDVSALKSVNHHRINVIAPQGIGLKQSEARIGRAESEMSEVINNKRQNNQTASDHVSRRPARFDVISVPIGVGTGASVFDRQLDGEVDV